MHYRPAKTGHVSKSGTESRTIKQGVPFWILFCDHSISAYDEAIFTYFSACLDIGSQMWNGPNMLTLKIQGGRWRPTQNYFNGCISVVDCTIWHHGISERSPKRSRDKTRWPESRNLPPAGAMWISFSRHIWVEDHDICTKIGVLIQNEISDEVSK